MLHYMVFEQLSNKNNFKIKIIFSTIMCGRVCIFLLLNGN